MDIQKLEQNIAKDLNILNVLVDGAERTLKYGSFSERRPDLGKMRTCPHCHTRRLQSETCCTSQYAKVEEGKQFAGLKVGDEIVHQELSKKFLKRFQHKRHGQNRMFKIRELAVLFAQDYELLWNAMLEMRVLDDYRKHLTVEPQGPCCFFPAPAHIPAFAQRYFFWKMEQQDRRKRNRAKQSRKVNRDQ